MTDLADGKSALTDIQIAAIQILVDRALQAAVGDLNMEYRNVTNLKRLLETLDESHPRHQRKIQLCSDHIKVEYYMGKLAAVAQRIGETRKKLESEADRLALRLDDMDKKAPAAFDRAHSIIDQHNTDLDSMESELRQLSNLPLEK